MGTRQLGHASSVVRPWRLRITGEASRNRASPAVQRSDSRSSLSATGDAPVQDVSHVCAVEGDAQHISGEGSAGIAIDRNLSLQRAPDRRSAVSIAMGSGSYPLWRSHVRPGPDAGNRSASERRDGTGRHGCGGVSASPGLTTRSVTAATASTTTATAIKSSLKGRKVSVTT